MALKTEGCYWINDMKHLLIGVAAISVPAAAQDSTARIESGAAAKDCILAAAARFEASGEDPDDIATAAFGHCDREISAARSHGETFAAELLQRVRNMAVARVVEIRAARRSR